jgi:hypothetical protein
MMILTNGNPKKIRKIKMNLNELLKIENYRLPFNAGEYFDTNEIKFRINNSEIHLLPEKKEDVFRININSQPYFLRDEHKHILEEIVREILSLYNERSSIVSPDTVYNSINQFIESEMRARKEGSAYNKKSFDSILFTELKQIIENEITSFEFFSIVEGIEIKNIETISCGNVELFVFEKKHCDEFTNSFHANKIPKDSENFQETQKYFHENFLGKVCMKSTAYGDEKTAKQKSYRQMREVINFFRYIICLLIHERASENIAKINILSETYKETDVSLIKRNKDNQLFLSWGRGRKSREKFCIDKNRMDDISSDLEGFSQIISSDSSITEVEESILKAIYWIGEAQNEFDLDIAFIKYWTAIECMFNQKQEITKSLAKGVTISIIFNGYQDIQDTNNVDDAKLIYKEIEKLYDKRSLIIHQGKTYLTKQVIDEHDISAICKYAAWSVLNMFYLRSIGYVTRDEIKKQIDRLSSILKLK